MDTYLKFNKNLKSQKATAILLSLFLLFFISSIIGIIYSYNKRIFQLAKQEKDNHKTLKKQFDEIFANLYVVDLIIVQKWQGLNIQNLDLISTYLERRYSATYHYQGNSSNSSIGLSGSINIDNDTFNLFSSVESDPPINYLFNLPTAELKAERNNIADRLKTPRVKEEIERDLKELLGNNIEILEFNEDNNNNNEIENKIKKGQEGTLKYTVIVQKNIKIPKGKEEKETKFKYQIELEYKVSLTGSTRVTFPKSISYTSTITETIYNPTTGKTEERTIAYRYDNDISLDITAKLSSQCDLTKFQIRKIK